MTGSQTRQPNKELLLSVEAGRHRRVALLIADLTGPAAEFQIVRERPLGAHGGMQLLIASDTILGHPSLHLESSIQQPPVGMKTGCVRRVA